MSPISNTARLEAPIVARVLGKKRKGSGEGREGRGRGGELYC